MSMLLTKPDYSILYARIHKFKKVVKIDKYDAFRFYCINEHNDFNPQVTHDK